MISPPPPRTDVPRPKDLLALMPFAEQAGVRLTAVSSGAVTGELEWAPHRCTTEGVMHGGALMLLADTVGAVAAFMHLPEGARTSTIASTTQFFSAVRDGTVEAIARVEHAGRSVMHVTTQLASGGRAVAMTSQIQAVR